MRTAKRTDRPTPSNLWDAAVEVAARALQTGALQPIDTVEQVIADGPIHFVVREVSSLLRKFAAQASAAPARNPFLPVEPALLVADLAQTHVVLLNKFPVMAEHLLVVTREFTPQDSLIAREDFVALAHVMLGRRCIAFYNGGRDAGASQPHRHLQLVPLPLEASAVGTPIDRVLQPLRNREGRNIASELRYNHALGWIEPGAFSSERDAETAGNALHACYRRLLDALGIGEVDIEGASRQSQPYNLVATSEWMLIVPRTRERYEGISVNALGFAGSLFVRDHGQLELVTRIGPRAVLAAVS